MNKKIVLGFVALFIVSLIGIGIYKQRYERRNKNNVIRICAVLPLTGNASEVGQNTLNGISQLLNNLNQDGTNKINYQFDAYDSQSDPKIGKTLIVKMLSENIKPYIVYSEISGVTINIREETEKNKIILLACMGSDELLNEKTKYTFRNFISPKRVGVEISKYIKDSLRLDQIGIYFINNNFGISYKKYVEKYCLENNTKISFVLPYEEKSNNYRDIIVSSSIKKQKCVYIAGVGKSIGVLIKQLREFGYQGIIIGDANLPNKSALDVAGENMNNVVYLDFKDNNNPTTLKIKEQYYTMYNKNPDNFALVAYEGLSLFLDHSKKMLFNVDSTVNTINRTVSNGIYGQISIIDNEIEYPLTFKKIHY